MATKVYTLKITYEGLEDKIWRKVDVSSNYRLDQLGYMVLSAFDTRAYHLFEFCYSDKIFAIPSEEDFFEALDMANYKLHQLGLDIGSRICMKYDFGTTQTFWIELVEVKDMLKGQGRRYV